MINPKIATFLKNLGVTSVDLVKRGANQDADIKLTKSADAQEEMLMDVKKAAQDASVMLSAFQESIDTIFMDEVVSPEKKAELVRKSISEFSDYMNAANEIWFNVGKADDDEEDDMEPDDEPDNMDGPEAEKDGFPPSPEAVFEPHKRKRTTDKTVEKEGKDNMADYDYSGFSPEEKTTFDALLAKACKKPVEKSVEDIEKTLPPEAVEIIKSIRQEVTTITEGIEKKEMLDVAKKYSPLGKEPEDLAGVLFNLKKSSPESYDAMVGLLDDQLQLVEKSPLFMEIGKSGYRGAASGSDIKSQIDAKAAEIMKSTGVDKYAAITKAWDDNPELAIAYEKEREGR